MDAPSPKPQPADTPYAATPHSHGDASLPSDDAPEWAFHTAHALYSLAQVTEVFRGVLSPNAIPASSSGIPIEPMESDTLYGAVVRALSDEPRTHCLIFLISGDGTRMRLVADPTARTHGWQTAVGPVAQVLAARRAIEMGVVDDTFDPAAMPPGRFEADPAPAVRAFGRFVPIFVTQRPWRSRESVERALGIGVSQGVVSSRREGSRAFDGTGSRRIVAVLALLRGIGEPLFRAEDRVVMDATAERLEMYLALQTASDAANGQRSTGVAPQNGLVIGDALLTRLGRISGDVVFRHLFATGTEYMSSGVATSLGYFPEEVMSDPFLIDRSIYPEDRHILHEIANGERSLDQPIVMRFLRRDGLISWQFMRVATITNDNGRILGIEGFTTDVTAMKQAEATAPAPVVAADALALYSDVTERTALGFKHQENDFVDFDRERLMPKLLSTEGPYLAVGDVNGDGLDDVFIGGAKEQAGQLLIQDRAGRFTRSNPGLFEADAISEDLGAVFFDANGDGANDLYVVSGGSEYSEGASALQDRLYLNDGRGKFRKAVGSVPDESVSGSRVVAADFDGDGAIDLFVGGRVVPWRYGSDPTSTLLKNDGRGHFTDVTAKLAPELVNVGMVTDAVWRDVDGDGRVDLVVVGEWMPITVFRNMGGGKLKRLATRGFEKSDGWWNRIVAGDFDGDGKVDFIVGNLGLNGRLHATEKAPAEMYVKDFDGNGSVEQLITLYNAGTSYPLALRDELLKTLPSLKPRYTGYKAYAKQTITDIFPAKDLADAGHKFAYTFATSLARNNGDGTFTMIPLPDEAQLAPVYGILATDVDRDGRMDILLAGNFDGFKPEIGRMSSSDGLLLRNDGKGKFMPVSAMESGFRVPGQARDIQRVRTSDGEVIVVARNNDVPLVFRAAKPARIARGGAK